MHILIHSLHDSIVMLPFLFLTYIFMEFLEHKKSNRMEIMLKEAKYFGPLIGALLGIIPQCGFSVIASGLYLNGTITLGTLISVFVSTSDEAIPILLSQPDQADVLFKIVFFKFIIGCISGYIVDLLIKKHHLQEQHPMHNIHEHCMEEQNNSHSIIRIAIYHTVKIFIFICIANFAITYLIHIFGENTLSSFLGAGSFLQPLYAAIVGFIPNCAASVILSQLYVDGVVSFGALTSGLITSAGLGLLVLFKMYDNKKDILRILTIVFVIALCSGIILQINI